MSIGEIIRSIAELALIVITIIALVKEPQIAAFERKFIRAVAIHHRNRRLHRDNTAKTSNTESKPENVRFCSEKLTA